MYLASGSARASRIAPIRTPMNPPAIAPLSLSLLAVAPSRAPSSVMTAIVDEGFRISLYYYRFFMYKCYAKNGTAVRTFNCK